MRVLKILTLLPIASFATGQIDTNDMSLEDVESGSLDYSEATKTDHPRTFFDDFDGFYKPEDDSDSDAVELNYPYGLAVRLNHDDPHKKGLEWDTDDYSAPDDDGQVDHDGGSAEDTRPPIFKRIDSFEDEQLQCRMDISARHRCDDKYLTGPRCKELCTCWNGNVKCKAWSGCKDSTVRVAQILSRLFVSFCFGDK